MILIIETPTRMKMMRNTKNNKDDDNLMIRGINIVS